MGHGNYSRQNILAKIESDITELDLDQITINLSDLSKMSIYDLEIVFQLIPDDTRDEELLSIVSIIIPRLSELLVEMERRGDYDPNLFSTRINVFRKFASFILRRNINEIGNYIAPFSEKISGNEETKNFITELISAEDGLAKNEEFWTIWRLLYNPITQIAGNRGQGVFITYLLAWERWANIEKEWHSLNRGNLWLYENIAKDLSAFPAVLYSIVRVLNTIGSRFVEDGIDWIYIIVNNIMICS